MFKDENVFRGSLDTLKRSFKKDPIAEKKLPEVLKELKNISAKINTVKMAKEWLRLVPTTPDYHSSKFSWTKVRLFPALVR